MILRPFVGDASEIMEMVVIGMRLRPAAEAAAAPSSWLESNGDG